MLVQRLTEYADRSRGTLPPPYYRIRSVRWAIRLEMSGRPASSSLTRLDDDDNPAGKLMAVPHISRGGSRPMLLADGLDYVLGFNPCPPEDGGGEADRRNRDFIALLQEWQESAPDDPVASAVASYFSRGLHLQLADPPGSAKPADIAAIMVDGQWAHERPSAVAFWASVARERKSSGNIGLCLACGTQGPLLRTIPQMVKSGAIPAGDGRSRDAALISVNKAAQGRGGNIRLASIPVCDRCGSAAMSALNALLADSASRYRTADSVLAWWLRDGRKVPLMDWLNRSSPERVEAVFRELHGKSRAAVPGTFSAEAFCAVTLGANQSRVVVRSWLEVPLAEVQRHLERWDADHAVTDLWRDGPQVVPLWLLAACAGRRVSANGQQRYLRSSGPHGLERDLLHAALDGARPPGYLLARLLQRIRADKHVDLPRAALLRLILIRSAESPKDRNFMTGLDPDLPSAPYQCGRLFAVLESVQRAALGKGINVTLADKYLSAATVTPLAILTVLRKNAQGHLRRLRHASPGAYYALNSRLDEVAGHFEAGTVFPVTLTLAGQAEFILGYHHQRAADLADVRARATASAAATTTEPDEGP